MPTVIELYQTLLCPYCRKIRLILEEKKLAFSLIQENAWTPSDQLLSLSPAGLLPVLVDLGAEGNTPVVVSHSGAISEYLEEVYDSPPLLAGTPEERAEIRRLTAWFDEVFQAQVTDPLLYEKIDKRLAGQGAPDMDRVRWGLDNLQPHLEYIDHLVSERRWLAGDHFSLADLTAAAHLSALDYLGDVPWSRHADTKEWYARLKSRPSFRPLLAEHIPGMPPPRHYADLDF